MNNWKLRIGLMFGLSLLVFPAVAYAQPNFRGPWFGAVQRPTSISPQVRLFEIDDNQQRLVEQLEAQMLAGEAEEALEGLRQLAETSTNQVLELAPQLYVTLADYCHTRIAALPEDTLALYRRRVDSEAKALFEQGLAERDERQLVNLLRRFYCSSYGDDALWALGELMLERGDYARAEGYWQQLFPLLPSVRGEHLQRLYADEKLADADRRLVQKYYEEPRQPKEVVHLRRGQAISDADRMRLARLWREHGLVSNNLCYPDTDLSLAQIHAGLILVKIRRGDLSHAEADIKHLIEQYPASKVTYSGSEVELAHWLESQLTLAERDAPRKQNTDWSTFGGNAARDGIAPLAPHIANLAFPAIPLEPTPFDQRNLEVFGRTRFGDDGKNLLAVHPVVWRSTLLYGVGNQLFAMSLADGKPAWRRDVGANGQIFEAPIYLGRALQMVGVPRYSFTVDDSKLYACVGSQITNPAGDQQVAGNMIVCLDLVAQGKLLWTLKSEETGWRFEGPPIADGDRLYVGVRKGGTRPTAGLECYDQSVRVGNQYTPPRMRWRTPICSAETPAMGIADEISHNLVTLSEGAVYYNTNLGAVAALDAWDGRPNWISQYPRAVRLSVPGAVGDYASHFQRDLNPCLVHDGLIYVAPSDSEQIFALEAATGKKSWATLGRPGENVDVLHLLGVAGDNLIACGSHLYWFSAPRDTGKRRAMYPGPSEKLGYGRGVLAGDKIFWCEQNALLEFNQKLDQKIDAQKVVTYEPHLVREKSLTVPVEARGGNLVPAANKLIVASTDKIYVFHDRGTMDAPDPPAEPTNHPSPPKTK